MAKNNYMKQKEQKNSAPDEADVIADAAAPQEEAAPQVEAAAPQEQAPEAEAAAPQEEAAPKLDFDAWFAMRGSKIPPQHHKEIVKADFKGRGLDQCESLEDFDAALRKYGVRLA